MTTAGDCLHDDDQGAFGQVQEKAGHRGLFLGLGAEPAFACPGDDGLIDGRIRHDEAQLAEELVDGCPGRVNALVAGCAIRPLYAGGSAARSLTVAGRAAECELVAGLVAWLSWHARIHSPRG